MNNFVIDTPDNFWQIRWLDKYMEGHKGFIAGGCFKNILSGERDMVIICAGRQRKTSTGP